RQLRPVVMVVPVIMPVIMIVMVVRHQILRSQPAPQQCPAQCDRCKYAAFPMYLGRALPPHCESAPPAVIARARPPTPSLRGAKRRSNPGAPAPALGAGGPRLLRLRLAMTGRGAATRVPTPALPTPTG